MFTQHIFQAKSSKNRECLPTSNLQDRNGGKFPSNLSDQAFLLMVWDIPNSRSPRQTRNTLMNVFACGRSRRRTVNGDVDVQTDHEKPNEKIFASSGKNRRHKSYMKICFCFFLGLGKNVHGAICEVRVFLQYKRYIPVHIVCAPDELE